MKGRDHIKKNQGKSTLIKRDRSPKTKKGKRKHKEKHQDFTDLVNSILFAVGLIAFYFVYQWLKSLI